MSTLSRLGKQIEEIIAALNGAGVRFALIGGLALASHKVIRATRDIDLLTDVKSADEIDRLLTLLGYRCIHRSADAGNYLRGDERVDFLYASRPVARQLLSAAAEFKTAFGDLRVVSLEGLIGFKLQGFVNDAPLAVEGGVTIALPETRDPFEVLDDLMTVVEALCPTWPPQDSITPGPFKL
ncbi:MAG: hypothetical protein QOD95_1362 [Gammaproteobacteria bacterium]|nr:hypothetical protein [Gammaproteobacteria bacterium]